MRKLLSRIKALLGLPPRVLWQKVSHRIRNSAEARWQNLKSCLVPTYGVLPDAQLGRIHITGFAIDPKTLPAAEVESLAAGYRRGTFDLLGSGKRQVVMKAKADINRANRRYSENLRAMLSDGHSPIDWHADFKSGYRWDSRTWHRKIRYGNTPGVDVKVPWELSRMQHLTLFACAALVHPASRPQMQQAFQDHVIDFIANNPVCFGVNWSCTMDVSIRVANWLVAFDLFQHAGWRQDPGFELAFRRSIADHGSFIRNNLEWNPVLRGNHYLANLCGLIFCAAYLPEFPGSDAWWQFVVPEFVREFDLQFHRDGTNFEGSLFYHRLSTEMVLYSLVVVLKRLRRDPRSPVSESGLDEVFSEKLARGQQFLRAAMHPDGAAVQLGDNDSGRFIKLIVGEQGFAYLVGMMDALAGKPGAQVLSPEASMLVAPGVIMAWPPGSDGEIPTAFPDFGLYVLRNDNFFLAAKCGATGQRGFGGHDHNDQLSFELSVGGHRVIVDPGTGVYTPDMALRNRLRGVRSHNTLCINGAEQNRWLEGREGLFSVVEVARTEVIICHDTSFAGRVGRDDWSFSRRISIDTRRVLFEDCWTGDTAELHLHFYPGITLIKSTDNVVKVSTGDAMLTISFSSGVVQTGQGLYSGAYGRIEQCAALKVERLDPDLSWSIAIG